MRRIQNPRLLRVRVPSGVPNLFQIRITYLTYKKFENLLIVNILIAFFILRRSLMVRHGVLVPAFGGSIPSASVIKDHSGPNFIIICNKHTQTLGVMQRKISRKYLLFVFLRNYFDRAITEQ